MTTLSVPIPSHLEEFINSQVKNGNASNKADVVRKALRLFAEQEAINDVLEAARETPLRGDLKELVKKFKKE
jgi:putative addiction module CopG family antidote